MDYKENDKIVWIYTEKFGKISLIAKGAKKRNNKFVSITQNFCYCNFNIYKGKGAYFLNEGHILDSFQEVLSDLDTLTYASYVCELVDLSQMEKEKNISLFQNVIKTMYFLKTRVVDIETLIRTYEIKLIKDSGYNLEINYCTRCGKKINGAEYFDLGNFGGVCSECEKNNCMKIFKGTYSTLSYIIKMDISKVYTLKINSIIKKELRLISAHIINEICVRQPKSLEMLKLLMKE